MIAMKSNSVPIPLYVPPNNNIKTPKKTIKIVVISLFLKGISKSLTLINCETRTELKKMATNKEEPKLLIRLSVIGS